MFVLLALTLNLFILTIGFSSQAFLTRSLDFSKLAVAAVVQYAVVAVVSIASALNGFSYWSLVTGSVSGCVAYVVILQYFKKASVWPKFDRKLMGELLGFGKHLLISGLMGFVVLNFDQLAIAKALGIASLGVYVVASRFGRTLGQTIAGAVNQVLFPTMARIKNDMERLKIGYVESLRMIAVVATPLSMGLSALSKPFVDVVLGVSWLPAVVPLAILSFQGLVNSLITPAANVLVSLGKPRYISIQSTMQAAILVIGVIPVVLLFGVNGVCILTLALSLGSLFYFFLVFSSVFEMRPYAVIRPLIAPILSGLMMFVVLSLLTQVMPVDLLSVCLLGAFGAGIYVVLLHALSKGRDVTDFIDLLRRSDLRSRNV
jgi:PST family polysaccharide transporter